MAFSILNFAKNGLKVTMALATFFLFGYIELEYKCGFVVSVVVGIYLFSSGARLLPTILVLGNVVASYFSVKPLVVLTFLGLLCMIFFVEFKTTDDTKVVLRPYESEVRNILFRHNPSLLHTVDTLLDEHNGREKELIYKLVTQYEGSAKKVSKAQSPKPLEQQELQLYPSTSGREEVQSTTAEAGSSKSTTSTMWSTGANAQSFKSDVASPTASGSTMSSYTTTVLKIKSILRRCDPALFASVDRMLAEYEGREGDLLREIQVEFGEDGNGNGGMGGGSGVETYSDTFGNPNAFDSGNATPHGASASGSGSGSVRYDHFNNRGIAVATGGSAFTSPTSHYTDAGYTPPDVYSVGSEFPSQTQPHRNPFSPSPADRFSGGYESYRGGGGISGAASATLPAESHNMFGEGRSSSRDVVYENYAPVPAQASPVISSSSFSSSSFPTSVQSRQLQDNPIAYGPAGAGSGSGSRYNTNTATTPTSGMAPRTSSAHTSTGTGTATSSAAQIRSAVAQAQEDARREMQARIDARWGAKPAASGVGGHSSAQKRHGYAFPG